MALITPEELIVYLDLPADTQPTDRATLVVALVVDAVTDAAGVATLTEPYPAGVKSVAMSAAARLYHNPLSLRSETVGAVSSTYAGDVIAVLTAAERAQIGRVYATAAGARGPLYAFPAPDWSWESVATLVD